MNISFTGQLDNIRQQTFSSILCQTLEDEPGTDLELQFQKFALLQPKEYAEFVLRLDKIIAIKVLSFSGLYESFADFPLNKKYVGIKSVKHCGRIGSKTNNHATS